MKKLMVLIGFCLASGSVCCQNAAQTAIKKSCDSIYNFLLLEPDNDKKAGLVIQFYLTSVDGFPVLLLELGQKLLQLGRERNDILIESSGWTALGQGHRLTGNYVRALEMHRKGVLLAEQSGNLKIMSFATNQMGHIYKDRLENEKALSLYKTALQYAEKTTGAGMWFPSMNLSTVYLNMGNMDSSMHHAQRALRALGSATVYSNHAIIKFTIATIYSRQGDSATARKGFREAIAVADESRSPRYLNVSYVSLAEHFNLFGQRDSAAWYCRKAVDAVQNSPSANLALTPARMLIDYYQDRNPDSTVKYWKVYAVANDSLNSARANQQIQMLTFEEDQRKRDIETENIRYRNSIRTALLLGGLVLFSLTAIFLLRNNRQKQKANLRLQQTLTELQVTQKQLVQSEKMASLGELTAGIAHEIQNPLNFVNNFSEVSKELLDEMKNELDLGNTTDAKQIATDVIQNLEKINHHGKRADAIVKGMLQHSRSSNNQKERTDINALADEYLRLAYHGLRAKDKAFNATLETSYDETIEKIDVIPQDIGRVILNLVTNAFYAVNERSKAALDRYQPTVWVSTKRDGDGIKISVRDNGNGIPQNILDKIFQPFFTTKPTGQGTGLGLSLAYDIVKAHGGRLEVETKEGEGTKFILQLPIC